MGRIAVTGAGGRLGREVVRAFTDRGEDVLALGRNDFDVTDAAARAGLTAWGPDVVINAAAWTDVDGCALNPERAMSVNADGAAAVAKAAADAGALVIQISTNEVFDGTLDRAYVEDDWPYPPNPYGASKLAGERLVARLNPRHMVIRTAWLFGPTATDFPGKIRGAAERARAAGTPLRVVDDEWGNPTWTPWLGDAIATLASEPTRAERGIWHLAGEPAISRFAWAQHVLRDVDVEIEPIRLKDYPRPSRPPQRAILDTTRAQEAGLALDWRTVAPLDQRAETTTGA